MRIAVTGRTGQVARALEERGPTMGHEILALARPELDLRADAGTISGALAAARPDLIVSAAAYTAVDKAEAEPDLAMAINDGGAVAVARAANALRVPLIHLSTDYVFDGTNTQPYVESDQTGPVGVYGRSKLAGEQGVLAAHDDVAILRTAWVYSPYGGNFVKTMLRLAADRDEIGVVCDQIGNPTSALDIADGILAVAANLATSTAPDLRGIFHMTGAGEATWAEFAEEIFTASAARGGPCARVRHIKTFEFPTPAKRPANSRLNCAKLAVVHGVRLPRWRQSTAIVVQRLVTADTYQ